MKVEQQRLPSASGSEPTGTDGKKRRRFSPWLLAGAAALIAGVAAGVATLHGEPVSPATEASPSLQQELRLVTVRTEPIVRAGSYTATDRFVGRIEAARSSDLGFELPGTIISIAVEEGSSIEEGQLLAELDTSRLEARQSELVAALEEATATVELASTTLERTAKAAATKSVSPQRLDEAKQQERAAAAAVDRIRAQLESVGVDLGKSRLLAPFSGQVAVRHVDEGTITVAGGPVLRVLETGRMEIRVGLSPRAVQRVSEGQKFVVRSQIDEAIQATVERILPQRDGRARTVDVILSIDSDQPLVREGDLVDVPVERVIEEAGYWLPRTALAEGARGLWAAFVAVPDTANPDRSQSLYRLERRLVEVLYQDGKRVFVRGALTEGDRVVVEGLQRFAPGQRVVESTELPIARTE